jgi:hypothetical protein
MDIITESELDFLLKNINNKHQNNDEFISNLTLQLTMKLKQTIKNLNLHKKSTEHLMDKTIAIYSFKTFCEKVLNNITTFKIYGSFTRQLFEKAFIWTFDESGYGSTENHDVDISIFASQEDYDLNDQMFWYLIQTLELMVNISETDENFTKICLFNNYHIKQIINLSIFNDDDLARIKYLQQTKESYETATDPYMLEYAGILQNKIDLIKTTIRNKFIGIPHFNIILFNPLNNTHILIDLLGYPVTHKTENNKEEHRDININTIEIKGNTLTADSDFMEILQCIIERNGICRINFERMIKRLEEEALVHYEKSIIYNNIINFMTTRTKILSLGYKNIYSNNLLCKFEIEKKEECDITNLPPPYIKINLKCGHSFSVMALSGITTIKSSEYSEAVQCPLCREKLIPNLEEKKINEIKIPSIEDIYTFPKEVINGKTEKIKLKYTKNEIISDDNVNYVLKNIYMLDSDCEDNNDDDNNDDDNDNNTQIFYHNPLDNPIDNSNDNSNINPFYDWMPINNNQENVDINITDNIFNVESELDLTNTNLITNSFQDTIINVINSINSIMNSNNHENNVENNVVNNVENNVDNNIYNITLPVNSNSNSNFNQNTYYIDEIDEID